MIAKENSAFPMISKKFVETLSRFRILDNHSSGEAMMSPSLYMQPNMTKTLLTLCIPSELALNGSQESILKEYESIIRSLYDKVME